MESSEIDTCYLLFSLFHIISQLKTKVFSGKRRRREKAFFWKNMVIHGWKPKHEGGEGEGGGGGETAPKKEQRKISITQE